MSTRQSRDLRRRAQKIYRHRSSLNCSSLVNGFVIILVFSNQKIVALTLSIRNAVCPVAFEKALVLPTTIFMTNFPALTFPSHFQETTINPKEAELAVVSMVLAMVQLFRCCNPHVIHSLQPKSMYGVMILVHLRSGDSCLAALSHPSDPSSDI